MQSNGLDRESQVLQQPSCSGSLSSKSIPIYLYPTTYESFYGKTTTEGHTDTGTFLQ